MPNQPIDPSTMFTGGLKIIFVRPFAPEDAEKNIAPWDKASISHVALENQPLQVFIATALREKGLSGRSFLLRKADLSKGEIVVEADLTTRKRDS